MIPIIGEKSAGTRTFYPILSKVSTLLWKTVSDPNFSAAVDYDPYNWREIRWDKNVLPYSQQSFDLIMEDCL